MSGAEAGRAIMRTCARSAGIHAARTVQFRIADLPTRTQELLRLAYRFQALAAWTSGKSRERADDHAFNQLLQPFHVLIAPYRENGTYRGPLEPTPNHLYGAAEMLRSIALIELQEAAIHGHWFPPEVDFGMDLKADPVLNYKAQAMSTE